MVEMYNCFFSNASLFRRLHAGQFSGTESAVKKLIVRRGNEKFATLIIEPIGQARGGATVRLNLKNGCLSRPCR